MPKTAFYVTLSVTFLKELIETITSLNKVKERHTGEEPGKPGPQQVSLPRDLMLLFLCWAL
jgi:hypothetical protein